MFTALNNNYTRSSYSDTSLLTLVNNLEIKESDTIIRKIALFILKVILYPIKIAKNIYYKNFKIKIEPKKEFTSCGGLLNSAKEFISRNKKTISAVIAVSSVVISSLALYNLYKKSLPPNLSQKVKDTYRFHLSEVVSSPNKELVVSHFNPVTSGLDSIKKLKPNSFWYFGAYDILKLIGAVFFTHKAAKISHVYTEGKIKLCKVIKTFYIDRGLINERFQKCNHNTKNVIIGNKDAQIGKVYRRCIDCNAMLDIDNQYVPNKPLAVYIFTSTSKAGDHNSAFDLKWVHERDFKVISETHDLLFCRIDDESSFNRVIDFLRRFNNINFICLGGHGRENFISFGENWKISKDENATDVFSKIKTILTRNGTLFFSSCLTGAKDGIAQKASQILKNRLVIGSRTSGAPILLDLENIYDSSNSKTISNPFPIGKILFSIILGRYFYLSHMSYDFRAYDILSNILYGFNFSRIMDCLITLAINAFPEKYPKLASFASGIQTSYRNGNLIDNQGLLTKFFPKLPSISRFLFKSDLKKLKESDEFRDAFSLILEDLDVGSDRRHLIQSQIAREAENLGKDPSEVTESSENIIKFVEGPRKEYIARAQIHFANILIETLKKASGNVELEPESIKLIQENIEEIQKTQISNKPFSEKTDELTKALKSISAKINLGPRFSELIQENILEIERIKKVQETQTKNNTENNLLPVLPLSEKLDELKKALEFMEDSDADLKVFIEEVIKKIQIAINDDTPLYEKLDKLRIALDDLLRVIRPVKATKTSKLLKFNRQLILQIKNAEEAFFKNTGEVVGALEAISDNRNDLKILIQANITRIKEIQKVEMPLSIKSENIREILQFISDNSNLNLKDLMQKVRCKEPDMSTNAEMLLFSKMGKLVEILKKVKSGINLQPRFFKDIEDEVERIKRITLSSSDKAKLINGAIVDWLNLENNPLKYWIQDLDLSNNNLEAIMPCISHFENLKHLNFEGNKITSIPEDIFGMASLKELNFKRNKLTYITRDISNLSHLKRFGFSNNDLEYMSPEITQ